MKNRSEKIQGWSLPVDGSGQESHENVRHTQYHRKIVPNACEKTFRVAGNLLVVLHQESTDTLSKRSQCDMTMYEVNC
jgi:hypothetical protein